MPLYCINIAIGLPCLQNKFCEWADLLGNIHLYCCYRIAKQILKLCTIDNRELTEETSTCMMSNLFFTMNNWYTHFVNLRVLLHTLEQLILAQVSKTNPSIESRFSLELSPTTKRSMCFIREDVSPVISTNAKGSREGLMSWYVQSYRLTLRNV